MRGRDSELDYEYLGRFVFNCNYKGCDPFHVASADRAFSYFRGTVEGKKCMSFIIAKLVFEAQQRGKDELIEKLRDVYDELWNLEDNSSEDRYSIETPRNIMYSVMDLAEEIIDDRQAYYS